jgi:hypothetical protein
MQVERLFRHVKDSHLSIDLPDSFNDRTVEIIILAPDQAPSETDRPHRRPHADIVGQIKIQGDILSTVPESDWDFPQ